MFSYNHFSLFPMGAIALLLASTMLSGTTSRPLLDPHGAAPTGFKVTLRHVDSGGNLTKFELFQRAVERGNKRSQRLYAMALAASDPSIESPIHAGDGEFLMELSIGTPPAAYSAILDTGSDLIWTQCKPCKQCFQQPSPIFDPTKSSSFSKVSCDSDLCTALPVSSCGSGYCEYLYTYGDYSSTQGVMATETLTFGNASVSKVGFGCGLDNEGSGFSQGSGLVGLGRGPLSLVSQLDEPKFSYCLTSIDSNESSSLLMGSLASVNTTDDQQDSIKTTPLIKSPSSPSFYYVSLEGITVGDTKLPISKTTFSLKDDGSGGVIVDSGTTITYLEESAFKLVKKEFADQMKLPVDDSNESGLDLCFKLPSSGAQEISVPNLVFHFEGADLGLPAENYIIVVDDGVACLAMGGSHGMSIFGNFQQQNMHVVHDLTQETMSFVPTKCDQL